MTSFNIPLSKVGSISPNALDCSGLQNGVGAEKTRSKAIYMQASAATIRLKW